MKKFEAFYKFIEDETGIMVTIESGRNDAPKDFFHLSWAEVEKFSKMSDLRIISGKLRKTTYDFYNVKKFLIEIKKELKKRVEAQTEDVEYVGPSLPIRAVCDYITINGKSFPVLSAYGRFLVKKVKNGKAIKIPMETWRILGEAELDPSARVIYPNQSPQLLLHYPEWHTKIRRAKLGIIYTKVRNEIATNVKFEDSNMFDVAPLWAIATHFSQVFNHFPVLDLFKAGYNTGGSIALKTIAPFCARPWIVQDATESALFRYTDDLRPTVGIEEFTTDTAEEVRNAILQLIDGAFDKNVRVPRVKGGKVIGHDFYGPKIVVDPQGLLSRYSTASRTLFALLLNVPEFQSGADDIVSKNKELIQTLYSSFLTYAGRVKKAYGCCKITGDGRADQAFRPLVALALVLKSEGVDVVDSLMRTIQSQYENLNAIKTEGDITKMIFSSILEILENKDFFSWFRASKKENSETHYIRISNLKSLLVSLLGVEFQTDTNVRKETRYWKRPPKEVAELLQDSKRFASLLKNFLPEYVGSAEPGSRHLCLYYIGDVIGLKKKLISLTGFNPTDFHKIPQVGLYVDPEYLYITNKKFLKSHKKMNKYMRTRRNIHDSASPRNVGLDELFNFLTEVGAGSPSNPTSNAHVGSVLNGSSYNSENTAPSSNPTDQNEEKDDVQDNDFEVDY